MDSILCLPRWHSSISVPRVRRVAGERKKMRLKWCWGFPHHIVEMLLHAGRSLILHGQNHFFSNLDETAPEQRYFTGGRLLPPECGCLAKAGRKKKTRISPFHRCSEGQSHMNEFHEIIRNLHHVQIDRMVVLLPVRAQLHKREKKIPFDSEQQPKCEGELSDFRT